ncbi:MAG: hypothetical protein LUC83_00285 [Clostridiales bacterium]|nr:hypothetical protein [Clostridiales bacterium]
MAYWAHMVWQQHNLRMEEFYAMPRRLQLLYIASELVAIESARKHSRTK